MGDSVIFMLIVFAVTSLPIPVVLLILFLSSRAIVRNKQPRDLSKPVARLGCGLMLALPICAFSGTMVAAVGGAVHPPVITAAARYVCDGTVESQSHTYSYRPGQHGVARNVFCTGPDGARHDISLRTFGAASIYYTLIFLVAALVLGGLAALLRPRRAAKAEDFGRVNSYLEERLLTGADIMRRTNGSLNSSADSAEERLGRLKSLRDSGMISDEEYQAKRAEILSSL